MLFQSAASLWFALALPAIVLMYILKRTYAEQEIASHLLWRQALREQEANRPWQKLRRSLLLLLQLLAAALLVLALMRPLIPGQPDAGEPAVIVLDTSASMTAAPSAGSEADDALGEAKAAVLTWMRSRPAAGPVTLIAAGSEPKLLLSADEGGVRAVEAALEEAEPSYGQSDLEAALSMAEAVGRGEAGARLVFATDGRWARQANEVVDALGPDMLTVGRDGGNTAIAAFGLEPAGGRTTEAAVTLVHYGDAPAEGVIALTPSGGDAPAAELSYALQAGEQRVFAFDGLPAAEYYRAELSASDLYEADNVAYALPSEAERGRALLVGEGNLFLDKALLLAGVETVQADPDTYEPDEASLAAIDWVVLDGTDEERLRQSEPWLRLLTGKPVWTIRSPDALPEGAAIRAPADTRIEMAAHPVTAYLSFDDTHIARLVDADPGNGLEPIVTYGGVPALYAGTVNGYPQLVMTFDLRDSDLPLRTDFPILIAQAAEWMSGALSPHLGSAAADSRIDVTLRAGTSRAAWEAAETPFAGASGTTEAERTADGAVAAVQTVPPIPGLYRFTEYGEDGGVLAVRLLAVHAASDEGAWTARAAADGNGADARENRAPEPDSGASGASSGKTDAGAAPGISIVPWIAALLLLLLAIEWEVYRRGTAS